MRARARNRAPGIALRCHAVVALLFVGCSGDEPSSGGATTPPQAGNAGSTGASGSGAGHGGSGGAAQANAGASASAGGGASPTGGSGAAGSAGGSAGGGAGAAGTAGAAGGAQQTSNPCAGLPAGCIALCEGGMCQCSCPDAEPCPASAPAQDAPCNTLELCGYGEPACHRIFECFTGVWKQLADTCADGPGGSCPATQGEALATACIDRRCGYGGVICQCSSPACSGVFMEPSTQCFGVTPAACLDPPVAGADCLPEGQRCGATCCGQQFTCTSGTWTSMFIPCPP